MIGGMCAVIRDVIPYGLVHGNRSILQGVNLIGLRRNNISNQDITLLSNAYKELFKSENLSENLKNLSDDFKKNNNWNIIFILSSTFKFVSGSSTNSVFLICF